ncbi:tektin-B1 [Lepeophtheirus salmonis]|uniref:tektin-B1 n=1 Tax=Lepeophtheirus salmonis TaxID=72036 RepID=UPI001AE43686|nr:tektin-B1-like [Lepeophtheirus salmonis]
MSGAYCERITTRYQPLDWHARNSKIVSTSRDVRDRSLNLRKDAQLLRVETDKNTKWNQFDNNVRLSERISEIKKWKKSLDINLSQVRDEIFVLKEAKEACEKAIEAKHLPYDITKECLLLRENGRRKYEIVSDSVESLLKAEVHEIDKIKNVLRNVCDEAWDQLNSLEEIQQRLEIDIQDKEEAISIDMEQLSLTPMSTGISHKPNATRMPQGILQPQAWHEFSADNKLTGERQMLKSQKLRTKIYHLIENTSNDLRATVDTTNFEFRKRQHEIKRSIEEIDYNINTTREEIKWQENNVRDLEMALIAKTNPLKLAETRLENRTRRPHIELCQDSGTDGLINEVETLRASISNLEMKTDSAKETLTELLDNLNILMKDRERKKLCLSMEDRCMDIRKQIKFHDYNVNSQIDKNMKFVGILRKKTKFLENSFA